MSPSFDAKSEVVPENDRRFISGKPPPLTSFTHETWSTRLEDNVSVDTWVPSAPTRLVSTVFGQRVKNRIPFTRDSVQLLDH